MEFSSNAISYAQLGKFYSCGDLLLFAFRFVAVGSSSQHQLYSLSLPLTGPAVSHKHIHTYRHARTLAPFGLRVFVWVRELFLSLTVAVVVAYSSSSSPSFADRRKRRRFSLFIASLAPLITISARRSLNLFSNHQFSIAIHKGGRGHEHAHISESDTKGVARLVLPRCRVVVVPEPKTPFAVPLLTFPGGHGQAEGALSLVSPFYFNLF